MAEDKNIKALMQQLDTTLTVMTNARISMENAAAHCQVQKGEPLYDRIEKCEADIREWEKDLNSLADKIVELNGILTSVYGKVPDEAMRFGERYFAIAKKQRDDMKVSLQKYRAEINKFKPLLRKIKA